MGKRLVKTPKVYFTDVGLAAHLLGIGTGAQVLRDPLVGGLFENLVVAEAMKWRSNGRRAEDFYFFRDSNGLEVDLVMEEARRLHLVEIKCAMTPNPSLERAIGRVATITSARVTCSFRHLNSNCFPAIRSVMARKTNGSASYY